MQDVEGRWPEEADVPRVKGPSNLLSGERKTLLLYFYPELEVWLVNLCGTHGVVLDGSSTAPTFVGDLSEISERKSARDSRLEFWLAIS